MQRRHILDLAILPNANVSVPTCINPLARPIPQLGSIDVFESAASSVYHGATLSIHRQMTDGFDFRFAYTFAHAMDDGQDALVAGRPALVQNSYSTSSERGTSLTSAWLFPGSRSRNSLAAINRC